jgi:CubicO group peptidase (beta-lactamase class C family)
VGPPGIAWFESAEWQQRVDDLARRHGVPGVQVGLVALGPDDAADLQIAVSGVTSQSTRVGVDADTLFQWGSITKVCTTTLIMQLIDEGKLDLDTRVIDVLADLTLADPAAAAHITVRQLLDHTSGIDGDVFTDTGDGDDCVARYVADLSTAASVTRPGGHHSYSNAGFVVGGRIIEVLRGTTWDDALAEHLLRPLGLDHVITKAKDAPLFRTAVGHIRTHAGGNDLTPTTTWMLPRSLGPAGLMTGSVSDLLRIAAAHLRGGLGLNGHRLLSVEAAAAMRDIQVDLSADSTLHRGWGLGWSLVRWGDEIAVSHGGGTIGQISDLHLFPDRRLAVAVLTNARTGSLLIKDFFEIIGTELGLTPPAPVREPDDNADSTILIGRWESTLLRWDITPSNDDQLQLAMTTKQPISSEPDPEPQTVTLTGPGRFLINLDGAELEVSHVRADGRDYLYFGRLLERASV